MCKAIVVGNEKSSLQSCLVGPLRAVNVEVLNWIPWAKRNHILFDKDAKLLIWNKCGLDANRDEALELAKRNGLDFCVVFANKHSYNINSVVEWLNKKKTPQTEAPEVAPPPPPPPTPPQGPPCVVCGKPVTKKHGSSSGWGWAKTCGASSCVRAARLAGCRKGNEVQAATAKAKSAKAKSAPVEVEVSEVNHRFDAIELVKVPFDGGHIDAVQDARGIWAGIRRMCEDIGVDVEGQRKKLKEAHWARTDIISARDSLGRIQQIDMLNAADIAKWLSEINPNKVDPRIKAKLEAYQVKARDVLAAHFTPAAAEAAGIDTEAVLMAALQHARDIKSLKASQTELHNRLEGLDSFAGNLESEQERIEREAKERADKEREERERLFAILRAKQEEIEDALTRPRGPAQTTIVNTRLIMEEGAGKLRDAMESLAVSAARARMREDWDVLEWVALDRWCYSVIYAKARELAQVKGKHALLTFSHAEAFKATLNEDMRQYAIRWTRAPKAIPPSYYETAKTFRRRPSQSTSNVLKLVKPEEPKAS